LTFSVTTLGATSKLRSIASPFSFEPTMTCEPLTTMSETESFSVVPNFWVNSALG
jgi:hypothetical protein